MAAEQGHIEVVEFILKNEKNAKNNCDEDENTALHLAASNKMTRTVETLLEYGSDVRKRNSKGWTPLECAAAAGSYKCVLKLLEARSEVDTMDKKKATPLHLTAIHGHASVARLLMDWGAKIEIEDTDGKNALELAIENGHEAVAEVILDSDDWKKAMVTSSTRPNKWFWRSAFGSSKMGPKECLDTPLRMLIRKFPSLAAKVLDKCITKVPTNKVDKNNNDNSQPNGVDSGKVGYKFDYTLLEDTYNYERQKSHVVLSKEKKDQIKFEWNPTSGEPYSKNAFVIQKNHPLRLMCKHQEMALLKHPLCLALMKHKWARSFWVYVLQFISYIVYLGLITSFVNYSQTKGKPVIDLELLWGATLICIIVGFVLEIFDIKRVIRNLIK